MNEQQKARIVELANRCILMRRVAVCTSKRTAAGRECRWQAGRISAEAFRIAQEAR